MVSKKRTVRMLQKDDELNEFEISNELVGTGAYSTIWKAVSKKDSHLPLVAKISKKNARRTKKNYTGALAVLTTLVHPNLIKLYTYRETSSWYYLFLEYHPKPTETLTELMIKGNVTDQLIVTIFTQVAAVVSYLHQNGWGHRDLKPCNVLFSPVTQRVTVLDLGFAMPTQKLCDDFTGSPLYVAPEVLEFKKYDINQSDCWSLGVVLYQLMYKGKYPFVAEDLETLAVVVNSQELTFPKEYESTKLRDNLKSIATKLLKKNPQERLTSSELYDTLKTISAESSVLDL